VIFGFLRTVWSEYEKDYARYFAAAMVYYALVSLVPLLLLVLAALGLLLRFSEVAASVEQDVLRTIEASAGTPMRATIEGLLDDLQQESVLASWVSLGGLLLAATALFRQLRLSFRAIWKYKPPLVSGTVRVVMLATVMEQAVAFVMVLMGGALLLVALVLIGIFQWLGGHLAGLPRIDNAIGWLLALPVPLIMVTLTFAMLFRFLPPAPLRWRHIWLVSLGCAGAWMIAAEILTLYGIFVADSFGAWGAIGGLLMIMLWMYVVSQILFYGAEVCKVMASREDAREQTDGTGSDNRTIEGLLQG
jgi:membrane protein